MAGLLAFSFLWFILAIVIGGRSGVLGDLPDSLFEGLFALSGVLSVIGVFVTMMKQGSEPSGLVSISWRDEGDSLSLSYTSAKQKRREGMEVRKMEAFDHPVYEVIGNLRGQPTKIPLGDTMFSIRFWFKGSNQVHSLEVGFTTKEEMDVVRTQLRIPELKTEINRS